MANNSKIKTALKMGLEVLLVLAIIGAIILTIYSSIELNKSRSDASVDTDSVTVILVSAILALVFSVIGLIGVLKENKCIVVLLLILFILEMIVNLVNKQWATAFYTLIIVAINAAFLFYVFKKDNNSETTAA